MEEVHRRITLDVELWELVWLNIPSIVDLCLCGMVCKEWNSRLDPLLFPSIWKRFFPPTPDVDPLLLQEYSPHPVTTSSYCVPNSYSILFSFNYSNSSEGERRKQLFLDATKTLRHELEALIFPPLVV